MLLRQGPRRAWDVLSMKHSALEPKSYGAPILSPFLKQARSAVLCFQCGRLRSDGHVGEAGSKMAGRYLCEECWSCFRKIRRCQQLELDRRVEKATYSDYSTATDELPSLEDVPQDWDRRHPMWQRSNETNPDWQLLRPKRAATQPESFAVVD
ncbi:hypothetical protein AK812_SmicGene10421 [Symbiodinium microadriaticum]|uniref:Uncharacterized protein n=1 Tax=Symbiodinium microadriaticum TaxID=2951 RepID=A0A1Q9EG19_SYMMI|nr:hypothetical protein AK812_SmicGene10421 [Symbiodinium microadriaticum]